MTRCLQLSVLLGAVLLCLAFQVAAKPKVTFATSEFQPYIGQSLPHYGYVYQVVTEAYQRSGWDVEIQFYPQARALVMARNGGVDGVLPVHASADLQRSFVLSAPFPGGRVGLLKRKGRSFGLEGDAVPGLDALLERLRPYRFGVVRGAVTGTVFDEADYLIKEFVSSDDLNIQKLFRGRIDLVVVDKYTAADLIVSQFPHMTGKLDFLPVYLVDADFHIAFSKETENVEASRLAFDEGLRKLESEGRLRAIIGYHGLTQDDRSPGGRRKIRVGVVENPHLLMLKKMSRHFEQENPDVELEWLILDEPILRLRTQSDLAIADGQFDVIAIGPFEAKNWTKRGWLAPLTPLPESYGVNDLVGPVREAFSYQGALYALPLYAESSMTFYRRDLFEQAGITMPDSPSYADILRFAEKVNDPGNGVYGICLRGNAGWGANMAYFNTLVNTYGGHWFNKNWTPALDSPAWHEALSFYTDILTKYGPPEPYNLDYNRILELFSEGHCGIWVDATSLAELLLDPRYSKIHRHLGWAKAPVAKTSQGSHWLWAWGLAIPSVSRNKVDAMRFLTWATSRDYIDTVARSEGWLAVPPGSRHSSYSSDYLDKVPFATQVYQAITTADPANPTLDPVPYQGIQYVDIPEYSSIGSRVGEKIEQALRGELTVDQALKQAQELVRKQMQASGYLSE